SIQAQSCPSLPLPECKHCALPTPCKTYPKHNCPSQYQATGDAELRIWIGLALHALHPLNPPDQDSVRKSKEDGVHSGGGPTPELQCRKLSQGSLPEACGDFQVSIREIRDKLMRL